MLLASACVAGIGDQLSAQAPMPKAESPIAPSTEARATENPTSVDLLPPNNSKLEIRMARRPWLLEKLTKPKTEPSIKMDPPRPPADIPDPPSTSRIRPKAGVGDGWMKRRADGQYNPSYADVPSQDAAKKQGWTVVDMKSDWKAIYPFQFKPTQP